MTLVSTPQSSLLNAGQYLLLMIVQVRLQVVVLTQSAHEEDAARGRIRLSKQAPMLQYLEAEGWRCSIQRDDVNWPAQRAFQQRADFQGLGEHHLIRQPFPKQHSDIHITQCMRRSSGDGTEQVNSSQVTPARQDVPNDFGYVGVFIHKITRLTLNRTEKITRTTPSSSAARRSAKSRHSDSTPPRPACQSAT